MKLVTFTMLAVLLSVGYAFAGEGTPAPRTGEFPFVYTVQDLTTGKCSLTTTFPDYHKYKIMGLRIVSRSGYRDLLQPFMKAFRLSGWQRAGILATVAISPFPCCIGQPDASAPFDDDGRVLVTSEAIARITRSA